MTQLIWNFVKSNKNKFDLIIDCTGSKKLIEKLFHYVKNLLVDLL